MSSQVISIKALGSASPLGSCAKEVEASYSAGKSFIRECEVNGLAFPAAKVSETTENALSDLYNENSEYKKLDRAAQLAILAGRELIKNSKTDLSGKKVLVNIGSSRGATETMEKNHEKYLKGSNVSVLTSPLTTLGNLSSSVLHDLKLSGFDSNTSVTCSTAVQSILNSIAWLSSGMADYAIAGASEAALTGFTISQMKALRVYADYSSDNTCCTPCADTYPANAGMVLGEGAALALLEKKDLASLESGKDVYIESFGYGSEEITHHTSISKEGAGLYAAMKKALEGMTDKSYPDIILLHAPGTEAGDMAEVSAVNRLHEEGYFPAGRPLLLSNKWIIGHTFGAAAAFNLEYAHFILKSQKYLDFPYAIKFSNENRSKIKKVMLNATGFGGNAGSVILTLKE